MQSDHKRSFRHRRGGMIALGAIAVLVVSYAISLTLHLSAVRKVDAAAEHIARADWAAAIRSLDTALWEDPFLVEGYLLRATAIDGQFSSGPKTPVHTRQDALADLDFYLWHRPDSGEAHYQRGLALAGLAKVETARAELAAAIPMLDDPTSALIERAALSFHVGDYKAAVREITQVIERHPLVPEHYETRELYRRFAGDERGARDDRARADRLRDANDLSIPSLDTPEFDRGEDRPKTNETD